MAGKPRDYTPHQQKIIRRYYQHADQIGLQKLAELVGEIYLAEGAKADRLWKKAVAALQKLGFPQARIDHLAARRDPGLLAEVVREVSRE